MNICNVTATLVSPIAYPFIKMSTDNANLILESARYEGHGVKIICSRKHQPNLT